MRQRWAGLATTLAVIASFLALNGAIESAKAADSPGQTWTLYAAGDVARADSGADEQTAAIIKAGIAADPDHTRVAMLGDGAYPDGTYQTYLSAYDKTTGPNATNDGWGQFKDVTYPTPGNHDYGQQMGPLDDGYRQYWDPILQKMDKSGGGDGDTLSDHSGWYSVDIGPNWHLISLNWACGTDPSKGSGSGCGAADPQGTWLAGDLQQATAAHKHIIAMWHGARFFSTNDNEGNGNPVGPSTDAFKTNAYWTMLQGAGADVVLAGHQHNYEVFDHMSVAEPPNPPTGDHQGTIDRAGPREFVVGTGGGIPSHFVVGAAPATGSVKQIDGQFGVLKLTLHDNSYDWQFISAADGSVLNSGTDTTHGTISGTTDTTGTTGPTTSTTAPQVNPPAPGNRSGYWMLGSDGKVYAFGTAQNYGDAGLLPTAAAVHLEPTPSGNGYWIVDDTGGVSSYGDAVYHGGPDSMTLRPGEKVTSLTATSTGQGYWMFTNMGRVLPYGDAVSYGDMSTKKLNAPVLGSIVTPTGKGYYMVAADGGIFSFGDAQFYGSMGDKRLNAPVESLVPTRDGLGYWLVASDGGIFAFGDAAFQGSMGGQRLNKPITGMVRYADGYLMVGQDGGIFNFSSQKFLGSLGANPPGHPIVSVATLG